MISLRCTGGQPSGWPIRGVDCTPMRARWPLYALLASPLTFLASLYLPWQESNGPIHLFGSGGQFDGWSTEAGVPASLAAIVLAAGAAHMLLRPNAGNRLPVTRVALAMLYLAIGGLVVMRAEEKLFAAHQHYRFGYGAYIGLTSAVTGLLTAAAIELGTNPRRPSRVDVLAGLLGAGVLASFLLPWARPTGPNDASFPGIDLPVGDLAAAGVCLVAGACLRTGRSLYAALAIAVLTGAAVDAVSPYTIEYGTWLAFGFALGLVALAAFAQRGPGRVRLAVPAALTAAAATLLVVALFLPWQRFCSPTGQPFGQGLGICISTSGWASSEPGAVTGLLAIALILVAVATTWTTARAAEIALVIATLIAAVGERIGNPVGSGSNFGYGAYVGFAAAGILLLLVLSRLRLSRLGRKGILFRLAPLAAVLACFCAVALPLWSVLPLRWSPQVDVLGGWYAVAGVLLTVRLFRRWTETVADDSRGAEQLVILPLALLALTALDLIRERSEGMTWGGGILVGLCLLLALLGWKEQHGGLEALRVPEILRIDRLPEAEG